MTEVEEKFEGDNDADPQVAQQRKTFRRWVNSHLSERKMEVKHIINDWDDGILLVSLMEILAKTNLGKINTKPRMKLHNLENLNIALKFIGTHVKLVNIGSEDMFTHNTNIVLGLIWTIILRWGVKVDGGKVALLNWVNAKCKDLGGLQVNNFDKDWQDGKKFVLLCASVDPSFAYQSTDDAVANMNAVFNHAQNELNIPILLDPKDVQAHPDEKSVVTYVGMFFNEFGAKGTAVKKVKPTLPVVSNIKATTADLQVEVPEGASAMKVGLFSQADSKLIKKMDFKTGDEAQQITGLNPNTAYFLTATALLTLNNEETEASAPVEFSTSQVGAPNAPTLSQETPTSMTVELVGEVPGAEAYDVLVSSPASAKKFDRTIRMESGKGVLVVDQLAPGITHAFKIVAISPGGPSDPSAATTGKTKLFSMAPTTDNGNPGASVKVKDLSESEATVSINVPAAMQLPAGSRYRVQIMDQDRPKEIFQESLVSAAPNGDASCLVDELEPSHAYQALVTAISPEGVVSDASQVVNFSTLADAAAPKARIALITGGNSAPGVQLVKDLIGSEKFGTFDLCYVCIRQGLQDATIWEAELNALVNEPRGCQLILVPYDKRNAESVKEANKVLNANKLHLVVNNAKLNREQLAALMH